jgi:hypothetical protein
MVRAGKPPIADLTCWHTTSVLRDVRDEEWMGPKRRGEDDGSLMR